VRLSSISDSRLRPKHALAAFHPLETQSSQQQALTAHQSTPQTQEHCSIVSAGGSTLNRARRLADARPVFQLLAPQSFTYTPSLVPCMLVPVRSCTCTHIHTYVHTRTRAHTYALAHTCTKLSCQPAHALTHSPPSRIFTLHATAYLVFHIHHPPACSSSMPRLLRACACAHTHAPLPSAHARSLLQRRLRSLS